MLSASAFAVHAHVWSKHDPFAEFDRNIMHELGIASSSVDVAHIQRAFSVWSVCGLWQQWLNTLLLFCAATAGMMAGITRQQKLSIAVHISAIVVLGQVAMLLIPSFYIKFAVGYDSSTVSGIGPSPSEAAATLSLMFDGVAMTFLSAMYAFMLHGFAPGIFLGTCMHVVRVRQLISYASEDAQRRRAEGLINTADDNATNVYRETMVKGILPCMLTLNSLGLLLAPLGSVLSVIIVYQSIGAQPVWLLLWPACWTISVLMVWALCVSIASNWNKLIYVFLPL